jgi:hypothetical protein
MPFWKMRGWLPLHRRLNIRREVGIEGELTPEQAKFLESLKEQPAPEPPSTSTRLATILNRLDNPTEPQEQAPVEPRSTAEQINVILQDLFRVGPYR